jgi:hypothetical protein
LIAKRRPVAEPCHQHVQVGTENRGPTHLRRLLVPRGEVLHVHDRVTRMQHSGVGRLDVSAARRKPAQLRCVRQKARSQWRSLSVLLDAARLPRPWVGVTERHICVANPAAQQRPRRSGRWSHRVCGRRQAPVEVPASLRTIARTPGSRLRGGGAGPDLRAGNLALEAAERLTADSARKRPTMCHNRVIGSVAGSSMSRGAPRRGLGRVGPRRTLTLTGRPC